MEKEVAPAAASHDSAPVSEDPALQVERIPIDDIPVNDFKWDFDIIINLTALYVVFFASTWVLIVPSSIIGFITAAFPEDASKSVWIATSVTIANCVLSSFVGLLSDILGKLCGALPRFHEVNAG
jgi:hypothetical protein